MAANLFTSDAVSAGYSMVRVTVVVSGFFQASPFVGFDDPIYDPMGRHRAARDGTTQV
jgi:hypothetical protein